MYYILNANIGLRSYKRVPFCIVIKGLRNPVVVSMSDYFLMSECDGQNDIEENDDIKRLESIGYIIKCNKGEFSLSRADRDDYGAKCKNCWYYSYNIPEYQKGEKITAISAYCNYACYVK